MLRDSILFFIYSKSNGQKFILLSLFSIISFSFLNILYKSYIKLYLELFNSKESIFGFSKLIKIEPKSFSILD